MSVTDRIAAGDIARQSRRPQLRAGAWVIPQEGEEAMAVEAKTEKPDAKEVELIAAAQANIVLGVVAASISTIGVSPVSVNLPTWDVLACPTAIVGAEIAGLRLPPPGYTVADYATGLAEAVFDNAMIAAGQGTPDRQNPRDVRTLDSFALVGRAVCTQAGLTALLGLPGVTWQPLRWAGPYGQATVAPFALTIVSHVTPYGDMPHQVQGIELPVPSSSTISLGTAILEITFLSLGGGAWMAIPVRLS